MLRVEFKFPSYIGRAGGWQKDSDGECLIRSRQRLPLYLSIGIEPSATRNASNQKSFRTEITLILSRVLFFALFLLAVYAVQRFWFLRAWNWIQALTGAHWRYGLEIALIALALAVFAAAFDPLLGHVVSRVGFGKSLITFSRLWLIEIGRAHV